MDAVTMVLVFVGLMALAFLYARFLRQRSPTFREAAMRIGAAIGTMQIAIGEALLPAFESMVRSAAEFEEELAKINATIEETDDF